VALSPTPLVKTFADNAIGNLTAKSDLGTYTYPPQASPGRMPSRRSASGQCA